MNAAARPARARKKHNVRTHTRSNWLMAETIRCSASVSLTLPVNMGWPRIDRVGLYLKAVDSLPPNAEAVLRFDHASDLNGHLQQQWRTIQEQSANLEAGDRITLSDQNFAVPLSRVYHVIVYARQRTDLHVWYEAKYEMKMRPEDGLVAIEPITSAGSTSSASGTFGVPLTDNFRRLSRFDGNTAKFVKDCTGLDLGTPTGFTHTLPGTDLDGCASACLAVPECSYFDYDASVKSCVTWRATGINSSTLQSAPLDDGVQPRQCWAKTKVVDATSKTALCTGLDTQSMMFTPTAHGCRASCKNGFGWNGLTCTPKDAQGNHACAQGLVLVNGVCMQPLQNGVACGTEQACTARCPSSAYTQHSGVNTCGGCAADFVPVGAARACMPRLSHGAACGTNEQCAARCPNNSYSWIGAHNELRCACADGFALRDGTCQPKLEAGSACTDCERVCVSGQGIMDGATWKCGRDCRQRLRADGNHNTFFRFDGSVLSTSSPSRGADSNRHWREGRRCARVKDTFDSDLTVRVLANGCGHRKVGTGAECN